MLSRLEHQQQQSAGAAGDDLLQSPDPARRLARVKNAEVERGAAEHQEFEDRLEHVRCQAAHANH